MNKNEIKTKIINCDNKRKENTKVQNPIWSRRIIITSRSGTKNLMNHQSDIGKLYVYAIYPNEPKYQVLFNKYEQTGVKYFKDPKDFLGYWWLRSR